jgi:hypothetical protein
VLSSSIGQRKSLVAGARTFVYADKKGREGQFTNLGGKDWLEVTGEDSHYVYTEVKRGEDSIELFDKKRNVSVRIFSDRYEVKAGQHGKWEQYHRGSWRTEK